MGEAKQAMGPGDIAGRPATYAALALCVVGCLGLISWLHSQITARVTEMREDVVAVRNTVAKTREEFSGFRAEVLGEFKQLRAETATARAETMARFDRIEKLLTKQEPK